MWAFQVSCLSRQCYSGIGFNALCKKTVVVVLHIRGIPPGKKTLDAIVMLSSQATRISETRWDYYLCHGLTTNRVQDRSVACLQSFLYTVDRPICLIDRFNISLSDIIFSFSPCTCCCPKIPSRDVNIHSSSQPRKELGICNEKNNVASPGSSVIPRTQWDWPCASTEGHSRVAKTWIIIDIDESSNFRY